MPRMGTECDANGFAGAEADGDPEVIDVRGDAIYFRGERDWISDDVNKIAVGETQVVTLLFASMRQRSGGRWCRAGSNPPLSDKGCAASPKTKRADQTHCKRREMIARKRAKNPWRGPNEFVSETKPTVSDQIQMKMLARQNFSPA